MDQERFLTILAKRWVLAVLDITWEEAQEEDIQEEEVNSKYMKVKQRSRNIEADRNMITRNRMTYRLQ